MLGLAAGGPYLHAGGARTLEVLFSSDLFAVHRDALRETGAPPFTTTDVDDLVTFLLSIDEKTIPMTIPTPAGTKGGAFCKP